MFDNQGNVYEWKRWLQLCMYIHVIRGPVIGFTTLHFLYSQLPGFENFIRLKWILCQSRKSIERKSWLELCDSNNRK